jgi:hypothetical protein
MATVTEVIEEIKKKLNDNALEVTSHDVLKNNGVVLHGIVIKKPGCNICSTIYIDASLKVDQSPEIIADQVIKSYKELPGYDDMKKYDEIVDFNLVNKDNIQLKLINTEMNAELLKTLPHQEWMDLSAIVILQIDYPKDSCTKVTNSLLDVWKITEDQLFDIAFKNLKSEKTVIKTLQDVLGIDAPSGDLEMYELSNESNFNGARRVLQIGDTISEFSKMYGCLKTGLVFLPSSIHEFLMLKITGETDYSALIDMVREINATEVEPEDALSNNIYTWDVWAGWSCKTKNEKGEIVDYE